MRAITSFQSDCPICERKNESVLRWVSELLNFWLFLCSYAHCHLNGNDDVDVDVDDVDGDETFDKLELAERTPIYTQMHKRQMKETKAATTPNENENETTTEMFHGNTIIRFMVQTSFWYERVC